MFIGIHDYSCLFEYTIVHVYLNTWLYMFIWIHDYPCLFEYTNFHVYLNTRILVFIWIHESPCLFEYMNYHVYLNTRMSMFIGIHKFPCLFEYMNFCFYLNTCISIFIEIHVLYLNVNLYTRCENCSYAYQIIQYVVKCFKSLTDVKSWCWVGLLLSIYLLPSDVRIYKFSAF